MNRHILFSGLVATQAVLLGAWIATPSPPALLACGLALGGGVSSMAGLSVLDAGRRRSRTFMRDCTVLALVAWAVGLVVAAAGALAGA